MAKKYEFDEIVNELVAGGKGVKDLLRDMKDISSLMVDLAYSAVLFNNDEIANEVKQLEEEVNKLRYQVEIRAMLAAKTPMQATKFIGILKLAAAAENIANAAERLAEIVLRDVEIHPAVREAIMGARKVTDCVEVKKGSKLSGKTVSGIKKAVHGINVLAMKKAGEWLMAPAEGTKISSGDTIVISGTKDCLKQARNNA